MSSIGHLLTIISGVFFFLMLADSAIERKLATNINFGIPRFNKRVLYYIYKITFLQVNQRTLKTSKYLAKNKKLANVEYELFV